MYCPECLHLMGHYIGCSFWNDIEEDDEPPERSGEANE